MATKPITKDQEAVGLIAEAVIKDAEDISNTLIPVLNSYLKDLRGIRMGVASEIREIIRSSQELHIIVKNLDDLKSFAGIIMMLRDMLTPELMEMLRRLTGADNADQKKS
jgi:hypothetical protein